MTPDLDYAKLGRFLAGECSEAEAAEVREWLAADPAHRQALAKLERVWRGSEAAPPEWDEDTAWGKVAARLAVPEREVPRRAKRWFAAGAPFPWLGAAAAVVLLFGSGMLVTWLARDRSAPAPMREVATVRGQRAELRFPDGTRITLAADSRLRFPGVFKGRTRDVYLEGEALFRVNHDPARPFLVRAAGSVTEDLGTEFGLKAYPGTGHVQVVVAEGRVALRPASAPSTGGLVLTSNQLGRLTPDGRATITDHVDVDRYLGWSRGRLAFADVPLREVAAELAHWYDVEFEIPDSAVAARHLTASFGQEPLPDVLRIITLSLDIRYERVGGTVVFLSKHAAAPRRSPSLKSDSGGAAP